MGLEYLLSFGIVENDSLKNMVSGIQGVQDMLSQPTVMKFVTEIDDQGVKAAFADFGRQLGELIQQAEEVQETLDELGQEAGSVADKMSEKFSGAAEDIKKAFNDSLTAGASSKLDTILHQAASTNLSGSKGLKKQIIGLVNEMAVSLRAQLEAELTMSGERFPNVQYKDYIRQAAEHKYTSEKAKTIRTQIDSGEITGGESVRMGKLAETLERDANTAFQKAQKILEEIAGRFEKIDAQEAMNRVIETAENYNGIIEKLAASMEKEVAGEKLKRASDRLQGMFEKLSQEGKDVSEIVELMHWLDEQMENLADVVGEFNNTKVDFGSITAALSIISKNAIEMATQVDESLAQLQRAGKILIDNLEQQEAALGEVNRIRQLSQNITRAMINKNIPGLQLPGSSAPSPTPGGPKPVEPAPQPQRETREPQPRPVDPTAMGIGLDELQAVVNRVLYQGLQDAFLNLEGPLSTLAEQAFGSALTRLGQNKKIKIKILGDTTELYQELQKNFNINITPKLDPNARKVLIADIRNAKIEACKTKLQPEVDQASLDNIVTQISTALSGGSIVLGLKDAFNTEHLFTGDFSPIREGVYAAIREGVKHALTGPEIPEFEKIIGTAYKNLTTGQVWSKKGAALHTDVLPEISKVTNLVDRVEALNEDPNMQKGYITNRGAFLPGSTASSTPELEAFQASAAERKAEFDRLTKQAAKSGIQGMVREVIQQAISEMLKGQDGGGISFTKGRYKTISSKEDLDNITTPPTEWFVGSPHEEEYLKILTKLQSSGIDEAFGGGVSEASAFNYLMEKLERAGSSVKRHPYGKIVTDFETRFGALITKIIEAFDIITNVSAADLSEGTVGMFNPLMRETLFDVKQLKQLENSPRKGYPGLDDYSAYHTGKKGLIKSADAIETIIAHELAHAMAGMDLRKKIVGTDDDNLKEHIRVAEDQDLTTYPKSSGIREEYYAVVMALAFKLVKDALVKQESFDAWKEKADPLKELWPGLEHAIDAWVKSGTFDVYGKRGDPTENKISMRMPSTFMRKQLADERAAERWRQQDLQEAWEHMLEGYDPDAPTDPITAGITQEELEKLFELYPEAGGADEPKFTLALPRLHKTSFGESESTIINALHRTGGDAPAGYLRDARTIGGMVNLTNLPSMPSLTGLDMFDPAELAEYTKLWDALWEAIAKGESVMDSLLDSGHLAKLFPQNLPNIIAAIKAGDPEGKIDPMGTSLRKEAVGELEKYISPFDMPGSEFQWVPLPRTEATGGPSTPVSLTEMVRGAEPNMVTDDLDARLNALEAALGQGMFGSSGRQRSPAFAPAPQTDAIFTQIAGRLIAGLASALGIPNVQVGLADLRSRYGAAAQDTLGASLNNEVMFDPTQIFETATNPTKLKEYGDYHYPEIPFRATDVLQTVIFHELAHALDGVLGEQLRTKIIVGPGSYERTPEGLTFSPESNIAKHVNKNAQLGRETYASTEPEEYYAEVMGLAFKTVLDATRGTADGGLDVEKLLALVSKREVDFPGLREAVDVIARLPIILPEAVPQFGQPSSQMVGGLDQVLKQAPVSPFRKLMDDIGFTKGPDDKLKPGDEKADYNEQEEIKLRMRWLLREARSAGESADALDYFRKNFEKFNHGLLPLLETIDAVNQFTPGTPEWQAAFNQAIAAIGQVDTKAAEFMQDNSTPTYVKQLLDSFLRGFDVTRVTPIATIEREEKTREMAKAKKRAEVEQFWAENAAGIQAEMRGRFGDQGVQVPRIAWEEQRKLYRGMATKEDALRKRLMEFSMAPDLDAFMKTHDAVQDAQQQLLVAQAQYKQEVLRSSPDVMLPEMMFDYSGGFTDVKFGKEKKQSAASVYGQIESYLSQGFGAGYEEFSRRGNPEGRGDFLRKLVGEAESGQRGPAMTAWITSLKAAKKLTEEQMKDEAGLNAYLFERIKIMGGVLKVSDRLEKPIAERSYMMHIDAMEALYRRRRQEDPLGYFRAARGLSYTIGGGAIGMGVGWQIRGAMQRVVQLQQEVANIQGVLSAKSPSEAELIKGTIATTSARYGADLIETANAAKLLAQAGLNANEIMMELDNTMLGFRGMSFTVDQAIELQLAIRAITISNGELADGIDHTRKVFDKIARVEAQYAVTSQDLANSIKVVSPVINQFAEGMAGIGDAYDYTIGMTTVLVENLRITGKQAGDALKFIFSRFARPELASKLQTRFGVELGADPENYLSAPDLFGSVAQRFQQLEAEGKGAEATQLAALVGGGRRVNAVLALLRNYERIMDISQKSQNSFGDAQLRAVISTNTLSTSLGRLRSSFQLFADNLLNSTGSLQLFNKFVNAAAFLLRGVNGGGGGAGSLLAVTAGTAGAFQGGKKALRFMESAITARAIGIPLSDLRLHDRVKAGATFGTEAREYAAAMRTSLEMNTDLTNKQRKALENAANRFEKIGKAAPTGVVLAGEGGLRGMFRGGFLSTVTRVLGPTGVLATGAIIAAAAMGRAAKAWDRMKVDEKFNIKEWDFEKFNVRESPQYQIQEELARKLKVPGGSQDLFLDTMGVIENRGGSLQALLDKYKVGSARELYAKADRGEIEFEGLRDEILAAFIKDFKGVNKAFAELTDSSEQLEIANKLLGYAAFNATANIEAMTTQMLNLGKELQGIVSTGIRAANTDRNRRNWLTQSLGAIGDLISGTSRLNTRLPKVAADEFPRVADVDKPLIDLKYLAPTQQQTQVEANQAAIKELFMDMGSPTGIAGGLAQELVRLGQQGWTPNEEIGTLIARALTKAQKTKAYDTAAGGTGREYVLKYFIEAPKDTLEAVYHKAKDSTNLYYETRTEQTEFEAIAMRMARSMAATFGSDKLKALAGTDIYKGKESDQYNAEELVNQLLDKAQIYFEEWVRAAGQDAIPPGANWNDLIQDYRSANREYLNMLMSTQDGLHRFRDVLLDIVTSLYMDIVQFQSKSRLAKYIGTTGGGPQELMSMLEGAYLKMDTAREQVLVEIVKQQTRQDQLGKWLSGRGEDPNLVEQASVEGEPGEAYRGALQNAMRGDPKIQNLWEQFRQGEQQIKNLRSSLLEMGEDIRGVSLDAILPHENGALTSEAQEMKDTIMGLLDALEETPEGSKEREFVSGEIASRLRDILRVQNARIQSEQKLAMQLQMEMEFTGQIYEIRRREASLSTDIRKRIEVSRKAAQDQLGYELALLDIRERMGELNPFEYQRERAKLVVNEQFQEQLEAYQAFKDAQENLYRQTEDNINNSLAGIKEVANPEFWQRSGFGDGLYALLNPFISTMYNRVVDNMVQMISQALMESSFKDIFAGPEVMMKQAITDAGSMVAWDWMQALEAGGDMLAFKIREALAGVYTDPTLPKEPQQLSDFVGSEGIIPNVMRQRYSGQQSVGIDLNAVGNIVGGLEDPIKPMSLIPKGLKNNIFNLTGGKFPVFQSGLYASAARMILGSAPAGNAIPLINSINITPFNARRAREEDLPEYMRGEGRYFVRNEDGGKYLTRAEALEEEAATTFIHEAGHIADFRNVYPDLEAILESRFSEVPTHQYAATNNMEHFAEVFTQAVSMLEATKNMKQELAGYEITDPEFGKNYKAAIIKQAQDTDVQWPGTSDALRILGRSSQYSGSIFSDPAIWSQLRRPLTEEEKQIPRGGTGGFNLAEYRTHFGGGDSVPGGMDYNLLSSIIQKPVLPSATWRGFESLGPVLGGISKGGKFTVGEDGFFKFNKKGFNWGQFGQMAGTMIGATAGASVAPKLIGRQGGQWASMGSQLGAMAGNAIPVPVLGPIVGGMVGGAIGSLFDKQDDRKNKGVTFQQLQAIEAAQKETIQAIEQQTDSLLNPENMLLNLPSSFNVPGYLPAFGGAAGRGMAPGTSVTSSIGNMEININVPAGTNIDEKSLAREIKKQIENELFDSHDRRSWGRSKP